MKPPAVSRQPSAAAALALAAMLVTASAAAQVMVDPTRPPNATLDPELAGEAEIGGPVLQSVMISPTHRAAIISGLVVRQGEKYGDAVLIKVAENEVVLKSIDGSQVLKLYPGVEKREIVPVAVKTTPRKSKARRSGADSTGPGGAATR